jgi:hypothetical protein
VGQLVEWGPAAERKGRQSHYGWTDTEGRVQLVGKREGEGAAAMRARGV